MAVAVNPPRGMRDILAEEKYQREQLFNKIRQTYNLHGFDEIETPALEDYTKIHSGMGGDNEKITFSVLKRGLNQENYVTAKSSADICDLSLRFDLTLPLARFYATNHAKLPKIFRSIQIAPVWRAERPQKGRYRQFTQCDIDIIGDETNFAEIELINASVDVLNTIGLEDFYLRINDRRLLGQILSHYNFPVEQHGRVLIELDKLDKLGPEKVLDQIAEINSSAAENIRKYISKLSNDMQNSALEVKDESDLATLLPESFDMQHESIANLITIIEATKLSNSSLTIKFDPTLVRGMGYYTATIFEFSHTKLSYSIGGGGRYDGMIGRFMVKDMPAVGLSLGFERILPLISLSDAQVHKNLALIYNNQHSASLLAKFKQELVALGFRVRMEKKGKNIARQIDLLNESGFNRWVVIKDTDKSIEDFEYKEKQTLV